jgi:AcrR family transcriptional regulator
MARRRQIQASARDLFAQRGYPATSIEMIARHARLSVGAIYLYFQSKEDLYVSLLEDTLARFNVDLAALSASAATKRLELAWSLFSRWAEADAEGPRVLRLLAQPGVRAQLSTEVVGSVSAGLERIRQHLVGFIAEGTRTGIYHDVSSEEMADLAWALLLGMLDQRETRANLAQAETSLATASQRAFTMLSMALGGSRDQQVAA